MSLSVPKTRGQNTKKGAQAAEAPLEPIALDTLPEFMQHQPKQVKFHSAYPPFTTKVRVRSVMERAGFDVYKPPQQPQSRTGSPNMRNFSAPIKPYSRNKSSPQLSAMGNQNRSSSERFTSSPNLTKFHNARSSHSDSNGSGSIKKHSPLVPTEAEMHKKSAEPVLPHINMTELESPINPNDFDFSLPQSPTVDTVHPIVPIVPIVPKLMMDDNNVQDEQLYTPVHNQSYNSDLGRAIQQTENTDDVDSLESFDRKFQQDLAITNDDEPEAINAVDPQAEAQLESIRSMIRDSGDNIPAPQLSDSNVIPPGFKRLSTLATDDLNIYNLNGFESEQRQDQPDMSVIEERTFENSNMTVLPDIELDPEEQLSQREDEEPVLSQLNEQKEPQPFDQDTTLDLAAPDQISGYKSISPSPSSIMDGFTKHSANIVESPNLKRQQGQISPNINNQFESSTSIASSNNNNSTKFAPGEGPCRKCNAKIFDYEKKIWSKDHQLTGQWHRKCFGCSTCDKKFSKGSSCYVFEDLPYCEEHFHLLNGSLCKQCSRGVEGECMQNDLDEVFHFDCLRCGHCGNTVAGGDYFTYKNEVLCEMDAQIIMNEITSPTEESKMMKRRTRIMYL